jgi:FkbH-like protein
MQYKDILNKNRELKKILSDHNYKIVVLSNITTFQFNEILEYLLRTEKIPAVVNSGNFDNIVQDSFKHNRSNLVIVFWELCNITEGLHYKIESFNDLQLDSLFKKTIRDIDLVLNNLEKTSLVLFNYFNGLAFNSSIIGKNNFERVANRLNRHLEKRVTPNIKFIDLEKIIAHVGIQYSIGFRNYYSSKALYTVEFFKAYAEQIKPAIMAAHGKAKKAIIFDCDNTLWKGILGEDGMDGIEMSSTSKDGAIFAEVQSIAIALSQQGIIIGLCSKNNSDDVDDVLNNHPDMLLHNEHISIKKINWDDKASNLKNISKNLNIGLDSLVFVDDSSFEVNLIKEQIPEVMILQVPERLYNYPTMLRQNLGLFYKLSLTQEDLKKVEMYKNEERRENTRNQYSNIDDYLNSLELQLTIFQNVASYVPRMAQLTQKTNQFNLTTKRYTESDLEKVLLDKSVDIFTFSATDKFGDCGITGLCILEINNENQTGNIDTFLMSCRIIGRNLEYAFINNLIDYLKSANIKTLSAKYIITQKNNLVENFWEQCSFSLIQEKELTKDYNLCVENFQPKYIPYVSAKFH